MARSWAGVGTTGERGRRGKQRGKGGRETGSLCLGVNKGGKVNDMLGLIGWENKETMVEGRLSSQCYLLDCGQPFTELNLHFLTYIFKLFLLETSLNCLCLPKVCGNCVFQD